MAPLKSLGAVGVALLVLNEIRGLIVVVALIQSGVAGDLIKAASEVAREHSSPRQVERASSRDE
jgi:hypothetical protein